MSSCNEHEDDGAGYAGHCYHPHDEGEVCCWCGDLFTPIND